MNYVRQGYQEMAFNDDLDLGKKIYVLKDGDLCRLNSVFTGGYFFISIPKHKDPKNNCKSYIINDRKGNIYEVLQDDIDELGVNAPATLMREIEIIEV